MKVTIPMTTWINFTVYSTVYTYQSVSSGEIAIVLVDMQYLQSGYNNKTTRVAQYISGLMMKMRVFIVKNGFIIFQSILQHDFYTFACTQTPCRSTFSTPIETPQRFNSIF